MRSFNKIFGIGLSRTGTASLCSALNILGIPCRHWPREFATFVECRAVTDITVSCRFVELDALFPDSLFIFTERERRSWIASVTRHYRYAPTLVQELSPDQQLFVREAEVRLYGSATPQVNSFRGAYNAHAGNVARHFGRRPNDILYINIAGGDGWAKLCSFLCVDIPEHKFPHRNAAKGSVVQRRRLIRTLS